MIFPPGLKTRADVDTPTSAIDLLPSFLHVTGVDIPSWLPGQVLPEINSGAPKSTMQISTVQVDKIEDGIIKEAVATLIEENYKLIWTFGYEPLPEGESVIELYDLAADPEELENLYISQKSTADEMLDQLKIKMGELQSSYQA